MVELVGPRNPEITERRSAADAAALRPRAAGVLDDPMLSLEWWQQPVNFASIPVMLTVRQPISWPAKLRARRTVAQREATTAHDRVSETALLVQADAKRAYLDLFLAEESLTINDRVKALLAAMVTAADAKYRVGKSAQAVILKTQEELLTVENDRLDLERAREEAKARLNTLLDRAADAVLPPIAHTFQPTSIPSSDEAFERALSNRPELRLARDALAESDARLALARRETNPDLAVWAGYMVNIHGTDTFTAGVSSTLPVFSTGRRSALVQAAEAEVRARRAALEAVTRRTDQEIRIALLQIDAARRHERLHADKLIPLAEVALRSAEAAYENDRIDFFSVLDAARMVRDHHLNHARYLVEYQRRLVDLELAIGEPLTVRR
ncbi:MAG: TolC family protein [Polyangia bacterium]